MNLYVRMVKLKLLEGFRINKIFLCLVFMVVLSNFTYINAQDCSMNLSSASVFPGDKINLTLYINHEGFETGDVSAVLSPIPFMDSKSNLVNFVIDLDNVQLLNDDLSTIPPNPSVYTNHQTVNFGCYSIGVLVDFNNVIKWPAGKNQKAFIVPVEVPETALAGDYDIPFDDKCGGNIPVMSYDYNTNILSCIVNPRDCESGKIKILQTNCYISDENCDDKMTVNEFVRSMRSNKIENVEIVESVYFMNKRKINHCRNLDGSDVSDSLKCHSLGYCYYNIDECLDIRDVCNSLVKECSDYNQEECNLDICGYGCSWNFGSSVCE